VTNSEQNKRHEDVEGPKFYGRRKGRPLRKTMQSLLDNELEILRLKPGVALVDQFDHAPTDIFLEIGFGGGEHIAGLAKNRPDAGFVGAEPFINGVASLLRHIETDNIPNIRLFDDDVRLILPDMADASLAGAFVMFPDPWPKRRHAARRILQPALLDELARLIRVGGRLVLASDDPTAKSWLLQAATSHAGFRWQAKSPEDWRIRPDDLPETRYMQKALREDRRPAWFIFDRIA